MLTLRFYHAGSSGLRDPPRAQLFEADFREVLIDCPEPSSLRVQGTVIWCESCCCLRMVRWNSFYVVYFVPALILY